MKYIVFDDNKLQIQANKIEKIIHQLTNTIRYADILKEVNIF